MKVATIVPIKHLHVTEKDDYFMALSYLIDHQEYKEFFKARSAEGKYVILDNSAIETGEPEPFETYFEKAKSIRASCIMLPDVFQEAQTTLEKAEEALEHITENFTPSYNPETMIIPQGINQLEWTFNLVQLRRRVLYHLNTNPIVGISARYTSMFEGSRRTAVQRVNYVLNDSPRIKIHLLGCYANPLEEIRTISNLSPEVQGVDSSYPSVYAQHGLRMNMKSFENPRPSRDIDFVEDMYDESMLKDNIEVWRQACNGANY